MKCIECGAEMVTETEDYPYVEAGIEGVYLAGVKVSRCKNGHEEVAIPLLDALHREIALALASRPEKLRGAELRFLRKYLGFSGVDFAPIMGVTPETLSRWENEKEPMGATAERLARVLVQRGAPVEEYPLERLADVGRTSPAGAMWFKSAKGGWRREEAAP
jgi:putative transcriptional regulator